ncbi:RadC family protein [Chitinophaga japonensis]|uniref:DNA repair protein RadC n=1 Tax=Chitinophaga japonensis TaxID=104662 RepID=A0A562T4P3_CHIJA|nr:DNA repair protein RadC [Chitinophaga japonensis]TWI88026.1 DNA repair protein RadC [Chitinophaga japonensis]
MDAKVTPLHVPIKDWAPDDKPREKLIRKGTAALSDAELLAILLNNGHKQKSAIALAKEILHTARYNLGELGKLNVRQLKKLRGVGNAKAVTIVAAMELARRKQAGTMLEKQVITGGKEAALFFKPLLADSDHEAFYVLYLNHNCRVLHYRCISNGGISCTIADPRLIFREALETGASRLLLCHNHPSGSLTPSLADIGLTRKLKAAGQLFDIEVIDHIIVSEAGYYSMVEEGTMV